MSNSDYFRVMYERGFLDFAFQKTKPPSQKSLPMGGAASSMSQQDRHRMGRTAGMLRRTCGVQYSIKEMMQSQQGTVATTISTPPSGPAIPPSGSGGIGTVDNGPPPMNQKGGAVSSRFAKRGTVAMMMKGKKGGPGIDPSAPPSAGGAQANGGGAGLEAGSTSSSTSVGMPPSNPSVPPPASSRNTKNTAVAVTILVKEPLNLLAFKFFALLCDQLPKDSLQNIQEKLILIISTSILTAGETILPQLQCVGVLAKKLGNDLPQSSVLVLLDAIFNRPPTQFLLDVLRQLVEVALPHWLPQVQLKLWRETCYGHTGPG